MKNKLEVIVKLRIQNEEKMNNIIVKHELKISKQNINVKLKFRI